MKKLTLMLVTFIISFFSISQTPQAFNYQAVVRDNVGDIIAGQPVSFRISIKKGYIGGPDVYVETQTDTTNQFGLVNLEIGNGTIESGVFEEINWGDELYFLKIEMDETNGVNYQLMGISQLLSVPYSLYSESTGDTSRWRKTNDDLYFTNGNVGIGTDNPSSWAKLSVKGNLFVDDGNAVIRHTDATESFFNLYNTVSDWELVAASDNNRFDIRKWGGVPALSISDNNFIGIGTITPLAALHVEDRIRVGEDPSAPPVYGELYHEGGGSGFIINANAGGGGWADLYMQTNGITKMFIESNGNVGIGTTTPLSKLHIENVDISLQGSDILNEHLTIESSDAGLGLYSTNGGGYGSVLSLGEIVSGTLNNKWSIFRTTSVYSGHENQLRFSYGTDPSYAVNPTVLTLDEGGNVGIGTNSPEESALLDLNSNSKGFLLPRLTSAEISLMYHPADGLQVYNSDDGKLYIYVALDDIWKEISYGSGTLIPDCPLSITDSRDGQTYNLVKIGDQCWMAENLNIGARIDGTENQTQNSPIEIIEKYCYDDLESNCDTYGGLYQWDEMMQYTTVNGVQGICPTGWHPPTYTEWFTLNIYLGGTGVTGGKMKEEGTSHWNSPNLGATNESGYTGLPGGIRYGDSSFDHIGISGAWWSPNSDVGLNASYHLLGFSHASLNNGLINKVCGKSVRCIKD